MKFLLITTARGLNIKYIGHGFCSVYREGYSTRIDEAILVLNVALGIVIVRTCYFWQLPARDDKAIRNG